MLVLVGTATVGAPNQGQDTVAPAYNSLAVALSLGLVLVSIVAAFG